MTERAKKTGIELHPSCEHLRPIIEGTIKANKSKPEVVEAHLSDIKKLFEKPTPKTSNSFKQTLHRAQVLQQAAALGKRVVGVL